jgi:murein DD-endopeptidase MepM/ murein hydrolase activator NlpD
MPTYGAGIYYSWDYGVTWAQSNAPTTTNYAEACSNGNGKYWISTTGNTRTGLYYSSNYGQSWTQSNITTGRWDAIAMSENGQYCIAVTGGNGSPNGSGFLYSSNYGATWTASATSPPANPGLNGTTVPLFTQASSSSSGRYFYASSFSNGNWYSSNYGWRIDPISGVRAFHEGMDFMAEMGTPARAAAGGMVIYSDFHSQYGNMVEIDHGNGLVSRYAHLSKRMVKNGDVVLSGGTVGAVGTTGRSTGPHLHFEVRQNGAPLNPVQFLRLPG